MSIQEDTELVLRNDFPEASDHNHWCCCRNEGVSLCGQDVSDVPMVVFDIASCRVCEHLVDSDFCPLGLVCPSSEDNSNAEVRRIFDGL